MDQELCSREESNVDTNACPSAWRFVMTMDQICKILHGGLSVPLADDPRVGIQMSRHLL